MNAIPLPLQDREVARALEIARALARAGVPIFVAPPAPGTKAGFHLPSGWETTTPDPRAVDSWQPGWALCAVGGHVCDFLDIDPRNGGTESANRLNGQRPIRYGQQATPSGGTHDVIAPLRVGKGELLAGIDLQGGRPDGSGRGFVFIAPTIRPSKVDGVARPYRWLQEPDLAALAYQGPSDDSGAQLAALLPLRKSKPKASPTGPPRDDYYDEWVSQASADKAIATITTRITRRILDCGWRGFRNELNIAAHSLGAYVGSGYMSEAQAIEQLCQAIRLAGAEFVHEENLKTIEVGIADGALKPIYVSRSLPQQIPSAPAAGDFERIVDLGPYLDGTYTPPAPSVGAKRSDGALLLYPARWHVLIGLTESGKSLFATVQALGVMAAGGRVVYLHFEESSPAGTIERFLSLGRSVGVDKELLRNKLTWMSCERRWGDSELADKLAQLPDKPALVILDGINAAASQHGSDVEKTPAVGVYRARFVTPATALNAAVLSLGHPVKDRSRQDERHSFGSTAWLDEVDGAAFRMEASPKRPLGKGVNGSSAFYSVKDRYGEVGRLGTVVNGKEPGWRYLGQFVVDDSTPGQTSAYLAAPKPGEQPDNASTSRGVPKRNTAADDAKVLEVVAQLFEAGVKPLTRAVHAKATGLGKERCSNSLERLVIDGYLKVIDGDRGSKTYIPTGKQIPTGVPSIDRQQESHFVTPPAAMPGAGDE